MRTPTAYLRKSKSDDPARELSRSLQETAVQSLATRDGLTLGAGDYYVDWDRSADESKVHRRTEFQRLIRDIEADRVSVVYAYATDRLYRSLASFVRLTDAASAHDVRIVTERDGAINADGSPLASFSAGLGALVGKLELDTTKARARAAYEARKRRGDYIGQAPYGQRLARGEGGVIHLEPDPDRPVAPIVDAYKRAGRRARTAVRILNDELGIPAPYGGLWDRKSLLRVMEREAPELVPPRSANNRRDASPTPALFAK